MAGCRAAVKRPSNEASPYGRQHQQGKQPCIVTALQCDWPSGAEVPKSRAKPPQLQMATTRCTDVFLRAVKDLLLDALWRRLLDFPGVLWKTEPEGQACAQARTVSVMPPLSKTSSMVARLTRLRMFGTASTTSRAG